MSPTSRSKQHLEKLGYTVAIVERFNYFSKTRHDLFGIADLLCLKYGEPLLAVQTTTSEHLTNRMAKNQLQVQHWLSTGNHFLYHGWGKRGARGKRKLWQLDERKP